MEKWREELVEQDRLNDVDFHGRRIINAGRSINPRDYVTQEELTEAILGLALLASADDTDILDAVIGLSVRRQSDNSSIGGNEFEVTFSLPTNAIKTYDGYTIVIHDSNTLPTTTTFDTGNAGNLIAGTNMLIDLSKNFTPDALIGKSLTVFSPKRSGSPTSQAEGVLFQATITGNTATQIIFGAPVNVYNLSELEYYIVTEGGGNHWYEKVKFYTPLIRDRFGPDNRRVRFEAGIPTIYVWVLLHNYWGYGRVDTPATRTFEGISTTEIKLLSVDNGRIAALAVTFDKINVSELSAISANIGSVTAGTITGATIRTAASGARVELDSSNGLRAFDSGGNVRTSISLSGGLAAYVQTDLVQSIATALNLFDAAGTESISITSGSGGVINFITGSAQRAQINATGISGNGSQLTALNGSEITSGSISDARLSANVPLKNAVNTYSANNNFADVNCDNLSIDVNIYTQWGQVSVDESDLGSGTKKYLIAV